MAKLSMPGGINVADKRMAEHGSCCKFKNMGKYDDASQLKSAKITTPGVSATGKDWYTGACKKK